MVHRYAGRVFQPVHLVCFNVKEALMVRNRIGISDDLHEFMVLLLVPGLQLSTD